MKYIVYGAGNEARLEYCDAFLEKVSYFVDGDPAKAGKRFRGVGQKIYPPEKLLEESGEDIFIIISCIFYYPEVRRWLESVGFLKGKHFIWGPDFYGNEDIPDPYGYCAWEAIEPHYNYDQLRRRVRAMAHMISKNSKSVLDLGCGTMTLREFLKPEMAYFPVDYIKRDDSVFLADFNKHEFPDVQADCVFISGLLEYIKDMDWFIERVCACSQEVIFSYHPIFFGESMAVRHGYGFVNNFTFVEIIRRFETHHFFPVEERIYQREERLIKVVRQE